MRGSLVKGVDIQTVPKYVRYQGAETEVHASLAHP